MFRKISIHALREEGDLWVMMWMIATTDFNPRPPRGGRPDVQQGIYLIRNFNPRPPRGGRHCTVPRILQEYRFQSTPSARRATCADALQAGRCGYFNPRPPRGGRQSQQPCLAHYVQFQSTPSARRATRGGSGRPCTLHNFNPRPPRGGRHGPAEADLRAEIISIHALREEGD